MLNDGSYLTRGKVTGSVLVLAFFAGWSCLAIANADVQKSSAPAAQVKPATKPAPPAAKKASAKPARAASKATQPASAAQPQAKKVATKRAGTKPVPGKPAASAPAAKRPTAYVGKRDPFKLPPPPGQGGPGGPEITGPLPPGSRGLVISQLKLEGIVRLDTTNTMLAVVTNYTNRAYFLRENDAVYNGAVSKIAPDAVYFKENFLDTFGQVSSREVVKRLGPASGEGR